MRKNRSTKWIIMPVVALITFGLTQLAYRFPSVTEKIYSQKLYPLIAQIISPVSNIFPFSLDDIFYFLLILVFLILIALMLFRKISFVKAGKILVSIISITYVLFYFLWGFNYFREDLTRRLNLNRHQPNTESFIKQLKIQIENTNQSWCTFENHSYFEIDTKIEQSYKNLAQALKISYPAGKRKAKKITVSNFFAKAGISGYYGPFLNEVHVNSFILPVEYPFVLAHEKAHQFGITNEAEANFYAWLVCTNSNSEQLKYSANLHVLRYFLYQAYQLEEYPEMIAKLDERVKNDLQRISENWRKLRNEKIDKVASKANDIYLKSNKIEKGIEEYHGVLQFVMDYAYDSNFKERYNLNQY